MAGYTFLGQKPFSEVYFTGIVRDKQGRKMSKSLGNSPDLLELIDRYGADACRFGIMISSPAGNDLLWDESSNEQGRNFNNKIWNALKLVKLWEERQAVQYETDPGHTGHFAVHWFGERLKQVKSEVEVQFREFRLSEALKNVYSLIWDDFCSWYLEWIKPGLEKPMDSAIYEKTISYFEELMQLLHPFMPFITEEVYHQLRVRSSGDDLTIRPFATSASPDLSLLQQGDLLKQIITGLRDARNKQQLKPKEAIELFIETNDPQRYGPLSDILSKQVNARSIAHTDKQVTDSITVVIDKEKFYFRTEKTLDTSSQKESLLKELDYYKGFLTAVDKKLSNERFVQSARPEVVELERRKKEDAEQKIKIIEESLRNIE